MNARRLELLLPLAVFLFAFLIRLPGIGWGLKNDLHNASLHPDETPNFGYSRGVVPGLGQFTPGFYSYGTLYLTSLRVASDVTTAYTGAPKTKDGWSRNDPSQTDWDWVARCTMAGRWLSLLFGSLTAAIAYALARRIVNPPAGLLAGAFIAIAPAHVLHSRFQTPDVMAAALIGGALYFAVRALDPKDEKARLSPATWCGILAGLSAGVKYTGILVLLALYTALALKKPQGWIRQAAVATAVALGVFVLTTPGVILENGRFMEDFMFEIKHTATGQELFFAGTPSGFFYHFANLSTGIGPILLLVSLVGLGWAAYRRQPWAFVLLAFLLPYYFLIGRAEVKYMRYTFPLYVGLAAGFGYAISVAQRRKGWDKGSIAVAILGIGGLPAGGVREMVPLTLGMIGEDPRDTATRFLKEDPKTVGLARDPWYWSPSLVPDGADPRGASWMTIRSQIQTADRPKIDYPLNPDGSQTYFDLSLFDQKPDRISTTNFEIEYAEKLRGRTDLAPGELAMVNAANAWTDRLAKEYEGERLFVSLGGSGIKIDKLSFAQALAVAKPMTYGVEDMDYTKPYVIVWKRKTP